MKKVFVIKIGVPYSEKHHIHGYTPTKKMGEKYLASLGYNHRNSLYGYYEKKPVVFDGEWARIEEVKPLFFEKLFEE